MQTSLVQDIRKRIASQATEELLELWKANNRTEWSEEGFEAIRQELVGRGIDLPAQGPPAVVSKRRPDPVGAYESGRWLAVWTIGFKTLEIAATTVLVLSIVFRRTIGKLLGSDWGAIDSVIDRSQMLVLGTMTIAGIVFLLWLYRTHHNLRAFGAGYPDWSPGMSVGGFFIPFLNLVWPGAVMPGIAGHGQQRDDMNPELQNRGRRAAVLGAWAGRLWFAQVGLIALMFLTKQPLVWIVLSGNTIAMGIVGLFAVRAIEAHHQGWTSTLAVARQPLAGVPG